MALKTNKITFLMLAMSILLSTNAYSQRKVSYLVHHKNGSIVRGIIEKQTKDTIVMRTKHQNIVVFSMKDLADIKFDNVRVRNCKCFNSDTYSKGIYNYSTVGLLINTFADRSREEDNRASELDFKTSVGYEFSHWLGLGLGVGLNGYETGMIPLTFEIKSHIFHAPNSPLINLRVGYAFATNREEDDENGRFRSQKIEYSGGLNYGFDIGIARFKSNNYAFSLSAGYNYQRLVETINSYTGWRTNTEWKSEKINRYSYHRISVRLGFFFRMKQQEDSGLLNPYNLKE